jgi:hypothetical protein
MEKAKIQEISDSRPRLNPPGKSRERPRLKSLVIEASQALARLDAERLEELALSCDALNRDLVPADPESRTGVAREAREAADEMAVFARVLEATRSNLHVMQRLRDLHLGRLEYGGTPERTLSNAEKDHGNN